MVFAAVCCPYHPDLTNSLNILSPSSVAVCNFYVCYSLIKVCAVIVELDCRALASIFEAFVSACYDAACHYCAGNVRFLDEAYRSNISVLKPDFIKTKLTRQGNRVN